MLIDPVQASLARIHEMSQISFHKDAPGQPTAPIFCQGESKLVRDSASGSIGTKQELASDFESSLENCVLDSDVDCPIGVALCKGDEFGVESAKETVSGSIVDELGLQLILK